jgi:hypothetical protein
MALAALLPRLLPVGCLLTALIMLCCAVLLQV